MFANLIKIAGSETIARAANWLTIIALAIILPPETFGVIVLIVAIEAFFQIIGPLGHDKLILLEGEQAKQKALKRNATLCSLLLSMALSPILLVVFSLLIRTTFSHQLIICLGLVLLGFSSVQAKINSILLRANHWDTKFARNRVVYAVFRVSFSVLFAKFFPENVNFIISAFIISNIISSIDANRTLKLKMDKHPPSTPISLNQSIKEGVSFFWHSVSAYLISFGDRFVVVGIADVKMLAAYGFWQSLISGCQFIYAALATYFESKIYKEIRMNGTHDYLRGFAFSSSVIVGMGMIVLLLLINTSMLSQVFIQYRNFEWIIGPLIFSSLIQIIYFCAIYYLTANGKSQVLAKTGGILILANLSVFCISYAFTSIELLLILKCFMVALTPYLMIGIAKANISPVVKSKKLPVIILTTACGLALASYSSAKHESNSYLFLIWIILMVIVIAVLSRSEKQGFRADD
jgi:O-antigen/teichoic acid export membrane protein